jgi:hypothetical protein
MRALILLFRGFQYAITMVLLASAAFALAIGGPPKDYEIAAARRALGGLYVQGLARVETAAHVLRRDYCAREADPACAPARADL